MDAGANSWAEQIAGALDWWREAGVDHDYAEAPRRWLAVAGPAPDGTEAAAAPRIAEPKAPPPPPPAPTIEDERASWPASLDTFAEWWLSEPLLDAGRTGERVPPRGAAGARLMLLVPQPEAEDTDTLLTGPQGRLVQAMLAAMGLDAGEIYLASILPRHTPMADWAQAKSAGLGEVLAHHVALAAPQRVIAFGDSIPSLLGHDLPNSAAPQPAIALGDAKIPLLAVRSLEGLLARPGWKADVWRKWLEWTR